MLNAENSTLARVFSILNCLTDSGQHLSIAEVAEKLNLPKPTVYRIVNQLLTMGLLQREPLNKNYIPGHELEKLALRVLSNSTNSAPRHAILQKLSNEVKETCNITFLDGKNLVYIDRVEAEWPIRIQLPLGSRVPLHCTASGKLFLANMNDNLRKKMTNGLTLLRYTNKTIIDRKILVEHLQQIKETGIGIDEEEFIKGMVAVAVPVIDPNGRTIFTVAIHAPTVRKSIDDLRQYIPLMRRAAAEISTSYL